MIKTALHNILQDNKNSREEKILAREEKRRDH